MDYKLEETKDHGIADGKADKELVILKVVEPNWRVHGPESRQPRAS